MRASGWLIQVRNGHGGRGHAAEYRINPLWIPPFGGLMGTPEQAGDAATRKGSPPIKVYCLPSERQVIEQQAPCANMTCATFLRKISE
jgi:hypothetical protein